MMQVYSCPPPRHVLIKINATSFAGLCYTPLYSIIRLLADPPSLRQLAKEEKCS